MPSSYPHRLNTNLINDQRQAFKRRIIWKLKLFRFFGPFNYRKARLLILCVALGLFVPQYARTQQLQGPWSGHFDFRQANPPISEAQQKEIESMLRANIARLMELGIQAKEPKEYCHCQITTLKSALIHPIIQSIPFDLKTSAYIFRNFHSALGLINLNFCDYRRDGSYVTLAFDNKEPKPALSIHYASTSKQTSSLTKII